MANSTFKAENGLTVVGDADVSANVTASVATRVGANVVANTSALLIGNTTVNATLISTQLQVANSTNTATLAPTNLTIGVTVVNTTSVGVGSNAVLSTTTLLLGNSTVNTTATQTTISLANTIQSANLTVVGLAVGNSTVNSVANTTQLSIANSTQAITATPISVGFGNSSVNSSFTLTQLQIANSTNTATLTPTSLTVGTQVANTTGLYSGANVFANTTTVFVGNSTVNVVVSTSGTITASGTGSGFSGNGASLTSVNAATVGGNTAATLTSAATTAAATAYTNATAYAANASNISSGTLDTERLPATANVSTAINVGANVSINTSAISIGNSTVNVQITSTSTITANSFSGNGAGLTSVNASTVGSNTASDLRSYSDTVAGTAYTNATAFAANASNISSGTLNTARLPATANVTTAINVGGNVNITVAALSIGNSTINTQINSTSVSFFSNGAILLPSGNTADRPTGANGQIRYNNELGTLETYVSGGWTQPSLLGDVTITSTPNKIVQRNATADVFANNVNLLAGANVGTLVTVGGNVSLNVTTLAIGNSTVNSTLSSNNLKLGGSVTANGGTGTAGQVLISGGAANAYWGTALAAGGADTQIQFNDGGSTLGGDIGLTYNKTTDTLSVANVVSVGSNVSLSVTTLLIGNTTVNTSVTTSQTRITNSTANVTLTPISMTVGTQAVNTTGVFAGANVFGNTTTMFVGNTTVNTTIGNGSISFGGTPTITATVLTFSSANSIVLPVGNTSQRPTGSNGHVRYSNTTNTVEAFVNGAWAFVPTSNNSSYITVAATTVANTIVVRDSTADVYANNFYSTSDATLKVGAVPITSALDKLEEIVGYLYTMRGSNDIQAGFFAQDVQKPMPYAVREQDGKLRLAYQQLIPVLWEAVKELKHIVLKQ